MSRGPGRIESAIVEIFTNAPDDAYSTEDLIDRVFAGINRVEKKHRVSIIRAAKNACKRVDGWSWAAAEGLGGGLVFWTRYSVASYALMRVKTDMFAHYRTGDARIAAYWVMTPEAARAAIEPGGKHHHHVTEGGAWWRSVQLWIAERDNDNSELVQALRERAASERAAFQRSADVLASVLKARNIRKRGS